MKKLIALLFGLTLSANAQTNLVIRGGVTVLAATPTNTPSMLLTNLTSRTNHIVAFDRASTNDLFRLARLPIARIGQPVPAFQYAPTQRSILPTLVVPPGCYAPFPAYSWERGIVVYCDGEFATSLVVTNP